MGSCSGLDWRRRSLKPSESTLQVSQNQSDNSSRAKMSFQKPEKDFGEGPKIHKIRITLTSRKVQSLEKVCSELLERAKSKHLRVKGPVRPLPRLSRSPPERHPVVRVARRGTCTR